MSRLFSDTRLRVVWLVLRLWIGWEWLHAGFEKLVDPKGAWVGAAAGSSLKGFFGNAVKNSTGAHPSVLGWYASFLKNVATPAIPFFTYLVPVGELTVGVALILGGLTLTAAFFGAFMNLNFMLAGSTGVNPEYFTVAILLLAAGSNAGFFGIDGYLATRKAKAATHATSA